MFADLEERCGVEVGEKVGNASELKQEELGRLGPDPRHTWILYGKTFNL